MPRGRRHTRQPMGGFEIGSYPIHVPYGTALAFVCVMHLGLHRPSLRRPGATLPCGFSFAEGLVLQLEAVAS
jgi:hypothetical protein